MRKLSWIRSSNSILISYPQKNIWNTDPATTCCRWGVINLTAGDGINISEAGASSQNEFD